MKATIIRCRVVEDNGRDGCRGVVDFSVDVVVAKGNPRKILGAKVEAKISPYSRPNHPFSHGSQFLLISPSKTRFVF
jgi:hypothetical protein